MRLILIAVGLAVIVTYPEGATVVPSEVDCTCTEDSSASPRVSSERESRFVVFVDIFVTMSWPE